VWHSSNKATPTNPIKGDTPSPRVGVGAGVMWRSPFGLIGFYYAPYTWGQKSVDRVQQFNVTFGSGF
jgi:outer membrane protein assembly factor BamA